MEQEPNEDQVLQGILDEVDRRDISRTVRALQMNEELIEVAERYGYLAVSTIEKRGRYLLVCEPPTRAWW